MSMNRHRILIVDDDPLFRALVQSTLREDYLVFVADGGAEGLRKALRHPPSVAIIDIKMPDWDGLKTLARFRREPALSDVKVMMLTSDASKETVVAAVQAGANDYLIKTGFSRAQLLNLDFYLWLIVARNYWKNSSACCRRAKNRRERTLQSRRGPVRVSIEFRKRKTASGRRRLKSPRRACLPTAPICNASKTPGNSG